MQLACVFVRERRRRNRSHEIDDEIPSAGESIEHMDIATTEAGLFSKLRPEQMVHAGNHKVYNRLWCVNDPKRICLPDGETLEETFVYGVEELLLLGEVGNRSSCLFQRRIKWI